MSMVSRNLGHFEKMTAPDRPMAGAFATVRLADKYRVFDKAGKPEPTALCAHPVGRCHFSKCRVNAI